MLALLYNGRFSSLSGGRRCGASSTQLASGHSSASMVAYAMLAYLATRLLPTVWHAPAAAVAGVLIFTTGWSRVVLHVHYASDVLAGWSFGTLWALAWWSIGARIRLARARE